MAAAGNAQTRTNPIGPDGKPSKSDPILRRTQPDSKLPMNPLPAVNPREPKPFIPRQIKASPESFLNREIRVAGQPTVKQEAGTGKWVGTSDGMKVELTSEARAYLERQKPLGKRPVFKAEVIRRDGEFLILYKAGEEAAKD